MRKVARVEVICENAACHKKFTRLPHQLSFRNYCSQKCYGVAVEVRNRATIKNLHYCQYCGERLTTRKRYCSNKCWAKEHKISKEKLIQKIQSLAFKLGRVPTRRECSHSTSCQRRFGSWNNALLAAGLTPHRSLNQKMYKRSTCRAKDGHLCNSISELIIDNWLFTRSIPHTKEAPYPEGKFTSDWKIEPNTFIEYFGLAHDSRRYDEEIKKKVYLCEKNHIKLIAIYAKNLYPVNNLEKVFDLSAN